MLTVRNRRLSRFCAAAAVAAAVTITAPAGAAAIQLGFILDRSGSLGSTNWITIVNGLATAVLTQTPVGGADTYEVSVVTFSDAATIDINSFTVTDAAQRLTLAGQIASIPFTGGGTNFAPAFAAMQTALTDAVGTNGSVTAANAARSYVNFATDGVEADPVAGVAARDALIAAGVDNISIEAIGSGVDAASLHGSYCYPLPCDTSAPFNFPVQGFYIGVANGQGYADALVNKFQTVTGELPEPGALALFGLAIAGLGWSCRRK